MQFSCQKIPFEKLHTGPLIVTFHKALRVVCLQLLSTACSAQTISAEAQNKFTKMLYYIENVLPFYSAVNICVGWRVFGHVVSLKRQAVYLLMALNS